MAVRLVRRSPSEEPRRATFHQRGRATTVIDDLPIDDLARARHNPHDRLRRDALATPRLTDDPERPATVELVTHPIDRAHRPLVEREFGSQVADF